MQLKKLSQNEAKIVLGKRFDLTSSKEFKSLMNQLIVEGINKVTLDFCETVLIDSSGLGKILYFAEQLRKKEGFITIAKVSDPEVRGLFELIKINRVVETDFN